MIKKFLFIWIVMGLVCKSTSSNAQQNILTQYIDSALKNNIALQQKNISVEKAMYSLKSARSLFQPIVALQGGYQTGEGGRSIGFPLGDLLNPVYTTLNRLTSSNKFPQVENVETNFFPKNFYDIKLNTVVPIYNKDIQYNKQIQEQQLAIQKTDLDAYKRELIKDIKVAYFNYLSSLRAINIYKNALKLAVEGKKISEKLLSNGKGLPAYILRSESEISQLNAQINESEKQAEAAKMYFNFLMNAELDTEINTDFNAEAEMGLLNNNFISTPTISAREELKLLEGIIDINKTALKMNQDFWKPKLNGYLNLGSQSTAWKFNGKSTYYLGGVQLDIPIFSGKRNQYKIKQSELDIQSASNNLSQIKNQLGLSARIAKNNLSTSLLNYAASQKQMEAAASYERLIDRGFREGVNTYIETLDARNQFVTASLLININQFKVLIAASELEREIASYNIQSK